MGELAECYSQVCTLGTFSVLGEAALADYPINGLPRPVSIVALSDIETYSINVKDILKRFPMGVIDSLRQIANSRAAFIDTRLESDVSVRVAAIADPRGLMPPTNSRGLGLLKVRRRKLLKPRPIEFYALY